MRPLQKHDRSADSRRDALLTGLDGALFGDASGPVADRWRELSFDVRQLTPPIDPAFEQQLRQRLSERAQQRQASPAAPSVLRRAARGAFSGAASLRTRRRAILLGAPLALATLVAVLVAVVLISPTGGGHRGTASSVSSGGLEKAGSASAGAAKAQTLGKHEAQSSSAAPLISAPAAPTEAAVAPGTVESAAGGSQRLQHLSASLTLAPSAAQVQATSDRVAQIATGEGGFVERSHVEAEARHRSEAELIISVPSAKLAATIAALGRLAPIKAESQSLQDVTKSFNATRSRLREARAEGSALLRTLASASTEEEVEALRRRLARTRRLVAHDEASLHRISRSASNAELEVTVLGNRHAASSGLTVGRGLHDALEVLTVVAVVLLIAAAVLIPLALVLGAIAAVLRSWRRYRRESALDAP
jgi:Domain of unknown function (DUF4349)